MTFLPAGGALGSGWLIWMSAGGVVGGAATTDLLCVLEEPLELASDLEFEPELDELSLPQAVSVRAAPRQTSNGHRDHFMTPSSLCGSQVRGPRGVEARNLWYESLSRTQVVLEKVYLATSSCQAQTEVFSNILHVEDPCRDGAGGRRGLIRLQEVSRPAYATRASTPRTGSMTTAAPTVASSAA